MPSRLLLTAVALVVAACSSGGDATTSTSGAPSAVSTSVPDTTPSGTASDTTTSTGAAPSTAPPDTTPDTTDTTTDTTPDSSPDTTSTTTDDPADLTDAELADRELARTALVTIDDFPDGWVEDPVEADEQTDDEFEADFDACLGRESDDQIGDRLDRLAVTTGDFHPAETDATQVSHEVVLAADASTAVERMAEVDVAGAEDCVAGVITRFYQTLAREEPDLDGIEIGDVIVTRTERERPADVAVGVLIEIPLIVDGQTVSQFLEFVYQRQGRALSELSFSSFGQPFSRDGYNLLGDEITAGLAAIGG